MKIIMLCLLFLLSSLSAIHATTEVDGTLSSPIALSQAVDSLSPTVSKRDSVLAGSKPESLWSTVAQTDSTTGDTLRVLPHSHFSHLAPFWQVTVPVGLSLIGVVGVADRGFLFKGKSKIQRFFDRWRGHSPVRIDDYLQYVPFGSFVLAAEFPGVPHRHNFRDRLLLGATAYAVMGATVNGVKYTIGELRPDQSAHNSFPSGHTATAVMGAELVRAEYGNRLGLFAYTGALAVGVLRMYNNRHWFNDVLGGAAFGFAAARIAFWLLPYEQRLLGIRPRKTSDTTLPKSSSTAMKVPLVLPTVSANATGLTALWVF